MFQDQGLFTPKIVQYLKELARSVIGERYVHQKILARTDPKRRVHVLSQYRNGQQKLRYFQLYTGTLFQKPCGLIAHLYTS